ncbi:hypothetical protein [Aquimarina sp. AU119]|uniref:hypothetical protein n=1 Tax=Aquimarina sp. AU119 TaxID=2108528 RepID=UPI000D68C05C|nr:hypothetical protein [Aquimarina sp. AU119]
MNNGENEKKQYIRMMSEFRSIIKYITQMAVASLILPIVFYRDIIGVQETISIMNVANWQLKFSWISLLISIGCGIWYQDIATRKIIRGNNKGVRRFPQLFYGLTVIGFYLGIGVFTWGVLITKG